MWPSLSRFLELTPQGHPRRLRQLLDDHGGFTISLRSGEMVRSGVSVAVRPSQALRIGRGEWSDRAVDEWMTSVAGLPAWRANHIGGWRDPGSGTEWLDVVRVMPVRWLARPLGRVLQQHYVFDLSRSTVLAVR